MAFANEPTDDSLGSSLPFAAPTTRRWLMTKQARNGGRMPVTHLSVVVKSIYACLPLPMLTCAVANAFSQLLRSSDQQTQTAWDAAPTLIASSTESSIMVLPLASARCRSP
ncbi:hypothetical protein CMEL01_01101 [Colletotrichum melonis]|uniref:Uncharacterized protein n=3 Tax=Colletotrichum acutatum species complex TaxID=2707335 RepID=A0AAJ0E113_9PEZI|nr:uncharacterized protein CCOS01_08809 [Colletotrichum costaricense]KAK0378729.1 hypothetical protein CLIM01_03894 [Colletotrichum limetticola]KAK1469334.1 hypothetical protein CMEL01_01101 [Colletotrichum melonis]KAK1526391.1 hypothetical protein CCOS01_08809 [Colletotrichum costaricense]